VLLREIHHRVKNNLQVITSLLQLQSGYLRDPEDAAMFQECQARIHSMALVHDRLYRSGNLTTLDFAEHLRELAGLIARSHSRAASYIQLGLECESLDVNLDVAIPLGLIIAELITNAYKHAFTGRPNGAIKVSLTRTAERRVTLTVEDDGVGLPAGFVPAQASTLGLRLIQALARQLQAVLSVESSSAGSKLSLSVVI
jgi:two-component sensor histidine kinase